MIKKKCAHCVFKTVCRTFSCLIGASSRIIPHLFRPSYSWNRYCSKEEWKSFLYMSLSNISLLTYRGIFNSLEIKILG